VVRDRIVISHSVARNIPAVAAKSRKQAVIPEAPLRPGFSAKNLERSFVGNDEIH